MRARSGRFFAPCTALDMSFCASVRACGTRAYKNGAVARMLRAACAEATCGRRRRWRRTRQTRARRSRVFSRALLARTSLSAAMALSLRRGACSLAHAGGPRRFLALRAVSRRAQEARGCRPAPPAQQQRHAQFVAARAACLAQVNAARAAEALTKESVALDKLTAQSLHSRLRACHVTHTCAPRRRRPADVRLFSGPVAVADASGCPSEPFATTQAADDGTGPSDS